MKKTKYFKLILDIILTAALLTLFSKNLFGLFYHEVVGLAVLIPILIHIIINLKTVRGMCKNFTRVPMNVKVCMIVDVLLLLVFVWMGVSGILISKTILTGISTSNMSIKLYHMSLGGVLVILLGIHIGLHICRKERKMGLAVIFTIIVLIGGIYGVCNSNIVRWLSMPFVSSADPQMGERRNQPAQEFNDGHELPDHAMNEPPQEHSNDHGPGNGFGQGKGQRSGQEPPKGLHKGGEMNLWQRINVLIQFFGMMFSCAMITYWIVVYQKKRRLTESLLQKTEK